MPPHIPPTVQLLAGLLIASGAVACTPSAAGPSGSAVHSSDSTVDGDSRGDSDGTAGPTGAARTAVQPHCSAGVCSECGDGVCPPGMFCMQQEGTAGCSWLPECGENDQCSCIARRLGSGCECQQGSTAPHVTCQ